MAEDQYYDITLVTPAGVRQIRVGATEHILDAAEHAGLSLPFICRQGRCLTCAGRLMGEGQFDPSDADMYFSEDLSAGFILLCTAKAKSRLRIRTHQESEMRSHRLELELPAPYS
jgi:ferredoxin